MKYITIALLATSLIASSVPKPPATAPATHQHHSHKLLWWIAAAAGAGIASGLTLHYVGAGTVHPTLNPYHTLALPSSLPQK